jgi:two-component system, NarL family, response regulator LiaR
MEGNEQKNFTLILVDDHEMVRRGLRAFFETLSDFQIVGEASDALGAAALARAKQPDLALVDLLMPGENGVGACQRIRQGSPNTKSLMLTSASTRLPVTEALAAGVSGFVFKDIAASELAAALRRVARGEIVLDARATEALRGSRAPNGLHLLSVRELEVVRTIAQGLSNKEIGDALSIAEKTVKSHVTSILQKLDLVDRTQVAVWVWRHGLNDKN